MSPLANEHRRSIAVGSLGSKASKDEHAYLPIKGYDRSSMNSTSSDRGENRDRGRPVAISFRRSPRPMVDLVKVTTKLARTNIFFSDRLACSARASD